MVHHIGTMIFFPILFPNSQVLQWSFMVNKYIFNRYLMAIMGLCVSLRFTQYVASLYYYFGTSYQATVMLYMLALITNLNFMIVTPLFAIVIAKSKDTLSLSTIISVYLVCIAPANCRILYDFYCIFDQKLKLFDSCKRMCTHNSKRDAFKQQRYTKPIKVQTIKQL